VSPFPLPHLNPNECVHMNFNVHAAVGRIQKSDLEPEVITAFTCDVRVSCRECGKPFKFTGLPNGFSFYQPTVSISGEEARLTMVHDGFETAKGLPGFSVTGTVFSGSEVPVQ